MQPSDSRFTGQRQQLIQRFFPSGIPLLWCPSLTHYTDDGAIDQARMRAHLKFMHPAVGGFLIPGSTGEGWEQSDPEVRELLDFMIDEIHQVGAHLLIGILKTKTDDVLQAMRDTIAWLKRRAGSEDILAAMAKFSVCGFTVCPPSGNDLSQSKIRSALEEVLALGAPVSLYQLPQVTQNEMTPETVAGLASKFPNFYLFKDTSGEDRVAAAGFRDAFLVRGAEGGYASHFAAGGGDYDGFLLSTANCFGPPLAAMIENVQRGKKNEATAFSDKLTAICEGLFDLAGKVGYGNAFTNANKAMDHFFAHGPEAGKITPPRLYSGKRLPQELIEAAGAALKRHGLMPEAGYLKPASKE
jgi:dihydrodipicolinate synthase/N-acetylneuraminate lyase